MREQSRQQPGQADRPAELDVARETRAWREAAISRATASGSLLVRRQVYRNGRWTWEYA